MKKSNVNNVNNVKVSKFLSYVLRHRPDSIGLQLSESGWACVNELIACAERNGQPLTKEQIAEMVKTNDKQRFSLSEDGQQIRANQGHSVKVTLGLETVVPPDTLYHGTATKFLEPILQAGLKPQARHHVHLSKELETAVKVGQRHGKLVILEIDAGQMHTDGFAFYCSANGVWLTDAVPTKYFKIKE